MVAIDADGLEHFGMGVSQEMKKGKIRISVLSIASIYARLLISVPEVENISISVAGAPFEKSLDGS